MYVRKPHRDNVTLCKEKIELIFNTRNTEKYNRNFVDIVPF